MWHCVSGSCAFIFGKFMFSQFGQNRNTIQKHSAFPFSTNISTAISLRYHIRYLRQYFLCPFLHSVPHCSFNDEARFQQIYFHTNLLLSIGFLRNENTDIGFSLTFLLVFKLASLLQTRRLFSDHIWQKWIFFHENFIQLYFSFHCRAFQASGLKYSLFFWRRDCGKYI